MINEGCISPNLGFLIFREDKKTAIPVLTPLIPMARYHIHTDEKEPKDSIRDRFVNLTRLHRALCLGYLLSNVRLIVFSWVLFVILGRYFTMILFSFELVLSVVFVLFGMSNCSLLLTFPHMLKDPSSTILLKDVVLG